LLWHGEHRRLFDDAIAPAAVGMSLDGRPPAEDPALTMRTDAADVVARMRVSTVTVESTGGKETYFLTVQVGFPTLAPARVDDTHFELAIDSANPSFVIVQSLDAGLRGMVFVGFVRYFAGEVGPEIHWHLTADTDEVRAAVQRASALAALEDVNL